MKRRRPQGSAFHQHFQREQASRTINYQAVDLATTGSTVNQRDHPRYAVIERTTSRNFLGQHALHQSARTPRSNSAAEAS